MSEKSDSGDVWLEASKQIAAKLGITYSNGELEVSRGSVIKSMGGWLGIAESIVPTLVFVIAFQIAHDIWLAIALSGGLSLIALIRQLIVRSALAQALVGAASIAITVWFTLHDNKASDYFLQGLVVNASSLLLGLASLAVRWPFVGLIVGFLIGEGFNWRQKRGHVFRFTVATAVWCSLFAIRLVVDVPLYLDNNLAALGVAKLVLGVPFYALTLWLIWLIIKPLIRRAS